MSADKHLQFQLELVRIFREIDSLPLDEMIEKLDKSLAFIPFIDPTLFMKKGKDAERQLRLFRIFRKCRDDIRAEFVEEGEIN